MCVPAEVLPCEMKDTFDPLHVNVTNWPRVLGAEVSHKCGAVVSGTALVFMKVLEVFLKLKND